MIFPTVQFAAFFVVVLCLSWALMPRPTLWKPFILVASYVFYGYADWRFVALLAASTVLNQTAALGIARSDDRRVRKAWLVAAVTANLGLLGVFKYLGFFVDSVDRLITGIGLGAPVPLLHVVLPIGISFFTFQAISYVADVHSGLIEPARALDFAIYEAFFPHLVAGPIVRAREFIPQLQSPRDRKAIPAGPALFLIAGGLIKKVVIADLLATHIVDPVFDAPASHSGPEALAAIYAYAVQIYCDFSAYTDMAIGLALLLGFRFPQNFNRPYVAVLAAGLLAPLAHDAVPLAAGLPLHPAGRQPQGPRADVRQPDGHDAARRAVARSQLDVRRLGRHPRHRTCGRALVAGAEPDRHAAWPVHR